MIINNRDRLRALTDAFLLIINEYGINSKEAKNYIDCNISNKEFVESALTTIRIKNGDLLREINN